MLVVAAVGPLLVRTVVPPGLFMIAALGAEAAALWRCVDPAVTVDGARARRVALGLTVSAVAGLLLGAALLTVVLAVAYQDGA